jgi:hypothetical protein
MGARVKTLQRLHRVQRVARAKQQLRRLDLDARMMSKLLAAGEARRQRLHAVVALQRILR